MTYKIPHELPSLRATVSEVADFMEYRAWRGGKTSIQEAVGAFRRRTDAFQDRGASSEEDGDRDLLDRVINEMSGRAGRCGVGYPFAFGHQAQTVELANDHETLQERLLYTFLLLCTRLDMRDGRTYAGVDGALLFESVSGEVLREYLGGGRAKSFVFGTEHNGTFCKKLGQMCAAVGEGAKYAPASRKPKVKAKDDGLDVVGWVPFLDGDAGKLIVFGQCKTGTSWKPLARNLRPDSFIKNWIRPAFAVDPIRAFFVCEATDLDERYAHAADAGVFFDRCRIVELGGRIAEPIVRRMRKWVKAYRATL